MNQHYICLGGCKGVSENPGICQAEGCPNQHSELVECPCSDGSHSDFKACLNCGSICKGTCQMTEMSSD